MAGTSNSIVARNVLRGRLAADNLMEGHIDTAFNPTYALVDEAGNKIVLYIDSTNYQFEARLLNKNNEVINVSNIIDLPLESMVVSGSYDAETKEVVLTLNNGNEVRFSIVDLIDGLVNVDDFNEVIDVFEEDLFGEETITNEGETLSINNTIKAPLEIDLKGNTYQETTTGKQLLDYTQTSSQSSIITTDSDGWVSFTFNNTGSSTSYINFFTTIPTGITIKTDTTYTIFLEIKNVSTSSNANYISITSNTSAFISSTTLSNKNLNTLNANTTYAYEITSKTDLTNVTGLLRTFFGVYSNTSASVTFRLSLWEGSVSITDFNYEKYTGGMPSPNPSYPQTIHIVSGNNSISVCGKNLFGSHCNLLYKNTGTWTSDGTSVTGSTTSGGYALYDLGLLSDYVGKTLTFSFSNTPATTYGLTAFVMCENDGSNRETVSGSTLGTNSSLTVTIPSGYTQTRLAIRLYLSNVSSGTFNNIQIEKNLTATTYEPYQSQTLPINLGTIELCKIGTYQDYIYKSSGKWYVHKEIGKVVLDGSESWGYYSPSAMLYTTNISGYLKIINTENYTLTNFYKVLRQTINATDFTNVTTGYNYAFTFANDLDGIRLKDIRFSGSSAATDFKTWLSSNNLEVRYVLATPTNTEITDTTLLSQLEAIKYSYDNQTNISQTNNDMPFIIAATAFKNTTAGKIAGLQAGKADKTEIPTKVSDLQNDSNYVKNTDYATNNKGGVIKVLTENGVVVGNTGNLGASVRTYSQYQEGGNALIIGKGTLENVITGKNLETANNKVTSISSSSTDTQYPSAKCVYDLVGDIETILTTLDIGNGV